MDDEVLQTYLAQGRLGDLADAVAVVDADWRYVYATAGVERLSGRTVDELLGQHVWEDVFPRAVGTPQHAEQLEAFRERRPSRTTWYFPKPEAWYEVRTVPAADGLLVLADDVTERERASSRAERLVEVGEALAAARGADEVNAVVVEQVLPLIGATDGSLVLADDERGTMRALGWASRGQLTDWEEYPLRARTPGTTAYRTGRAVFAASLEEVAREHPDVVAPMRALGRGSVAALPLPADGRTLGALVTLFAQERVLSPGDRQFLHTAAAMAAQALVRAALLDVERRSVQGLQRSLLPQGLPAVPGLDVTARYGASDRAARVGGDWYDVVPLAGGAVGLVLGDVEGHDLEAAALMGLVRAAVRAYALEGHPPAVLVARANTFLSGLQLERIVTLAYAQVHPAELLVTAVSAGHLPTLVVGLDGTTTEVPAEVGPPLGVHDDGQHWPETTSALPPHGVLAVFTDGLVEVRGQDLDTGLDRVRVALEGARALPLDDVAEALLTTRGASHDDVALLVARLTGDVPAARARRVSRRLPASSASVPLARRFTTQVLTAWDMPDSVLVAAELAVSELVTNAARHSEEDVQLALSHTAWVLRVEVGDSSHRMPEQRAVSDDESTSGRGLQLVEQLTDRWGVQSEGLTKVVWAEIDLAGHRPS